jgi:hypothetical protein
MNRIKRGVLVLVAAGSCFLTGCCGCTKSLQVTTSVMPLTGATSSVKIDFLTAAQCEVQQQIKLVMKRFVERASVCEKDSAPKECRENVNREYEPTINRLLEINAQLATRGAEARTATELINEAKTTARAYIGR